MLSVAVWLVLAPKGGLFARVIPKPTGSNGFEEYVRAAERIDTEEFRRWWREAGTDSRVLERNRWALDKYRPALELIRQGNAKPVSEPRATYTLDTGFPEYASFRQVTRVMVAAAYAEFAAGESAAGTDRLLQALTMARNVGDVGFSFSNLSGVLQEREIFEAFEARLGQLSHRDCARIDAAATELLRRPLGMARVFETSMSLTRQSLERALDPAFKADPGEGLEVAITKLTLEERRRFRRSVEGIIQERYGPLIRIFRGPESEWPLSRAEAASGPENLEDPEGMAQAFVDMVAPAYLGSRLATVQARTQLRLLRLHAKIRAYRWEHNRWPARLEDVIDDVTDPLSKKPFEYRVIEPGYRLVSLGRPETGEIALTVRDPAGSGTLPVPPLSEVR